jgi:hypothetical protein
MLLTIIEGMENENLSMNIMEMKKCSKGPECLCSLKISCQDINMRRRRVRGMRSLLNSEIKEKLRVLKILIWMKFPEVIDKIIRTIMFL